MAPGWTNTRFHRRPRRERGGLHGQSRTSRSDRIATLISSVKSQRSAPETNERRTRAVIIPLASPDRGPAAGEPYRSLRTGSLAPCLPQRQAAVEVQFTVVLWV